MNLTSLFARLTYRNALTNPDPSSLDITARRFGGRTVHHPDVPTYLDARRRRVISDLTDTDFALIAADPDLLALMHATAAQMRAEARQAGQATHLPILARPRR